MKRVYISGPITDDPDYRNKFLTKETQLWQAGYMPVNPARLGLIMPAESTWDEYMIIALDLLRMCDEVHMLEGWSKSYGARIEHDIAFKRGMTIVYDAEEQCEIQYT